MAGSCSHKTPFELHCSSCWNALVADRDEWKKRHDELSDTIVQFGLDNGDTAAALLELRGRAEHASEPDAPLEESLEPDLLDLLRKLASGQGGQRTGELQRRGWLRWEVTEAGRDALDGAARSEKS